MATSARGAPRNSAGTCPPLPRTARSPEDSAAPARHLRPAPLAGSLVQSRRDDQADASAGQAVIPDGCLAGCAVIETHNHGGVGDDDGIAATLGRNLQPALDRGDG